MMCMPSGNHDMIRISKQLDTRQMKLAYAFIYALPGAPFLYYGDEIGMRYVEDLVSVEGGYERTGSRSPMQWDKSTNAGFPARLLRRFISLWIREMTGPMWLPRWRKRILCTIR